jgi:hypothetical protein
VGYQGRQERQGDFKCADPNLPKHEILKCDAMKRDDQLQLFREAYKYSPAGKIHYIIANAGIARKGGGLLLLRVSPCDSEVICFAFTSRSLA